MTILSFVDGIDQRATLTVACRMISQEQGTRYPYLHHTGSRDFTDIAAKLNHTKPSLLVIDYNWSSVYSIDGDLHNYIIQNKTPVLLVKNFANPSQNNKGFPEGAVVISTGTDNMLNKNLVYSLKLMLGINEETDLAKVQADMDRYQASSIEIGHFDEDFLDEVDQEVQTMRQNEKRAKQSAAFSASDFTP